MMRRLLLSDGDTSVEGFYYSSYYNRVLIPLQPYFTNLRHANQVAALNSFSFFSPPQLRLLSNHPFNLLQFTSISRILQPGLHNH